MSSDLVTDGQFIHHMVDMHRTKNAALTVLLKQPSQEAIAAQVQAAKAKGKSSSANQDVDFIGLDGAPCRTSAVGGQQRLLYLKSAASVGEELSISKSLLHHYPSLSLHTTLKDAHFYILSNWVLDILEPNYEKAPPLVPTLSLTSSTITPIKVPLSPKDRRRKYKIKTFTSIKKDLVPFLVACQTSESKLQALPSRAFENNQSLAYSMSTTQSIPASVSSVLSPAAAGGPRASFSFIEEPVPTTTTSTECAGCYVHVMGSEGYCARANTLHSFMEMNRDIARNASAVFRPLERPGKNNYIHELAVVHVQTQIGPDCIVGSNSKIGARCGVKKSIIGKNCVIGDNVKIANSVIMDNVRLLDGSNITDSIICEGASIAEGCTIKDAQIGTGYVMQANASAKDEVLARHDRE
eukprot:TRINITY_DN12588_c0_g1_i4.p1 TRINITY_DN12588_c0_g1~~TRINITY_DN12588_c0_g1_i4.p1  ORF type:complete len:445 (-),score=98.57 TRINITY_DN12588_c0_g1_i4:16-1245(-)